MVFFNRRRNSSTIRRLEYIQSSGTQYIDTGFKPNQDTRVVMDAQIIANPSDHEWFYAGRAAVYQDAFGFYFNKSGSFGAAYGDLQVEIVSSAQVLDRLLIDQNKNHVTFNGTSHTFATVTFNAGANLTLLARNTMGSVSANATARLYSCKVYDNGTLIRDYAPCYDESDVACLYDRVNRQYVYNAGTGSFIAGPEL